MGRLGFYREDASGGLLVQPVDDARAFRATRHGDAWAVVEKGVGHGPLAVASSRMNDEASGFVEDEKRVVLKKNLERDVLRSEWGWGRLGRDVERDYIARTEGVGGLCLGVIHKDTA